MKNLIYLDNAATTYPKPEEVYQAMDKYLREKCVNAGRGSYKLSAEAEELIADTRRLIINMINGYGEERVIFSPSATIATNQLLRGLDFNKINNVYVTPFEHNAIMRTLFDLKKKYEFNINIIPFDNISFKLDDNKLKVMFAKNNPDVILMSHVSNVTGYILPIKECMELGAKYNSINIIDCAQSLGIVRVNIKDEFKLCDFIIFAGHKSLYGPLGVGGFIQINNKISLNKIITGGTGSESTNLEMPDIDNGGFEPGSHNTYAIAGLNAGLKWINKVGIDNIYEYKKKLSDLLVNKLTSLPECEVYIPEDLDKHIGVVSFNIDGYQPDEVGKILDEEYGVCVRTGHHCVPYIGEFLQGSAISGTVRVSVGFFNNVEEINKVVNYTNKIIY